VRTLAVARRMFASTCTCAARASAARCVVRRCHPPQLSFAGSIFDGCGLEHACQVPGAGAIVVGLHSDHDVAIGTKHHMCAARVCCFGGSLWYLFCDFCTGQYIIDVVAEMFRSLIGVCDWCVCVNARARSQAEPLVTHSLWSLTTH
jgi:hypothetical protein